MPVRRGLWRTAAAPGRDETRTRDPLVYTYWQTTYKLKIRANIRPILLRQGEPGTPQYIIWKRSLIGSDVRTLSEWDIHEAIQLWYWLKLIWLIWLRQSWLQSNKCTQDKGKIVMWLGIHCCMPVRRVSKCDPQWDQTREEAVLSNLILLHTLPKVQSSQHRFFRFFCMFVPLKYSMT